MISVDNAIELAVKTYLGLPKRARGTDGPGRKELASAAESFPALLDLLASHASSLLGDVDLGDVERYHRLRNQLYHEGNGITVERQRVEAYFQMAAELFESLFGMHLEVDESSVVTWKTGEFLREWSAFERGLRMQLPEKDGPAYYWKLEYITSVSPEAACLWQELGLFRINWVHGIDSSSADELDEWLEKLRRLVKLLGINPA
jgi:hypothetical protein